MLDICGVLEKDALSNVLCARMINKTAFEANELLYGKLVARKLAQGTFHLE